MIIVRAFFNVAIQIPPDRFTDCQNLRAKDARGSPNMNDLANFVAKPSIFGGPERMTDA